MTGVGCHALLQGIFLTHKRWNPHLLCLRHWQVGSLPLASPGEPRSFLLKCYSFFPGAQRGPGEPGAGGNRLSNCGVGAGEKAQAKFVTLFPPLSFPEVSLASSPHSPWAIFSLSTPSQGLSLTCPVSTAHPIPNLTISVCFWLM